MKYLFLLLLCFASSLFAINPGKWSYLDKFVIGDEKFGPSGETVANAEGKVVYSAKYEYNTEGKLVKETYTNEAGEFDGELNYIYENGRVISEELLDKEKELKEKKTYSYLLNSILKEINISRGEGKDYIKCKVLAMDKDLITNAETTRLEEKITEHFIIKKDSKDPNNFSQEVYEEKKKLISSIKFFFSEGKLMKRESVQGNLKRMQTFEYDEKGRLIRFTFHVKQNEDWIPVKTHTYTYS